jgi:hypothetical protein
MAVIGACALIHAVERGGWVLGSCSSRSCVGIDGHMMHVAEDDGLAGRVVVDVELVGAAAHLA